MSEVVLAHWVRIMDVVVYNHLNFVNVSRDSCFIVGRMLVIMVLL